MFRLPLFYLLVFISGFSGLLYEVVWQRYLAILLGAQAWATALVLAVYLGGLSAGYFLFGYFTRRSRWNLLKVYAGVEVALAAWAFAFPFLFQFMVSTIPTYHGAGGVGGWLVDLLATCVLLGIPTVLMGGTLPLLTQGLSTIRPDVSQTHARIYGFNTIGACFGCLATGYWLIPEHGLAWATRLGGSLNLLVGIGAFLTARGIVAPVLAKAAVRRQNAPLTRSEKVLLGIGFLSGFYLLALQSVLIRLMGLATGASNYNFSLIVSIFVFCLGFGSLAARKIDHYRLDRLFWNQAFAGLFLMLLYFSGDSWSYGAHVLRVFLRDIPEAFSLYQAMLGSVLFLLLAVPLGLTGLTLPLCFHLLKNTDDRLGERVGLLYGVNTLGCIAGALIGGYWLLNFLNLDQIFKLVVFSVVLTAAAAAYLAPGWRTVSGFRRSAAAGILAVVVAGTAVAPLYHKERFIQPFRHPRPMDVSFSGPQAFGNYLSRNTKLALWKDGPNTSLGVGTNTYKGKEMSRTVFVNAKSDGNTRGDLLTTNALAHIPGLLSAKPARSAVIGFGTGMTVGTLLLYPDVESIDVIEISGTIIQNAGMFDNYNGMASRSPKVHFREMDAMRFLGASTKPYDLIISEPSNPWVAGVENLFAYEFYHRANRLLAPGGFFVQWIHAYSFTDSLLSLVMGTMGRAFPYVNVFQLKGGDYALVASGEPISTEAIFRGRDRYLSMPLVQEDLAQAGVTSFDLFLGLQVLGPEAVTQISRSEPIVHSLVQPRLSDAAARAFFVGSVVDIDELRRRYRAYFSSLPNSLLRRYWGGKPITAEKAREFQKGYCEHEGVRADFLCREAQMMSKLEARVEPGTTGDWVTNQGRALASVSLFEGSLREPFEIQLAHAFDRFEAYKKYASPLFFQTTEQLLRPMENCMAKVPKTSEIWGQCMLQKVLVYEWMLNPSDDLKQAKKTFLTWFATLKPGGLSYEKLREAKSIIERM